MIDNNEDRDSEDKGKFAATFQPVEEDNPNPNQGSILDSIVVNVVNSAASTCEQEENGVVSSTTAAFGDPAEPQNFEESQKTFQEDPQRSPGTPTKDERDPSHLSGEESSPKLTPLPVHVISRHTSSSFVKSSSDGVRGGGKGTASSSSLAKDLLASKKKFRVLNLAFPAALDNEVLRSVMKEAYSFHIWFERTRGQKKGGISFLFDSESDAKLGHDKVKNLDIDGARVKIQAPKSLSSEVEVAKESSTSDDLPDNMDTLLEETLKNDEDCRLKLHISQLLPSTHDDLIYALFDKENLKSVNLFVDDAKHDGSKVAILTFLTEELAREAKKEYDGFSVDDGEVSRQIRIVWYLDFLRDKQRRKIYGSLKQGTNPTQDYPASPDQSRNSAGMEAEIAPEEYDLQAVPTAHKAANLWSEQIQNAKQTTTALPEREIRAPKEKTEEMTVVQIKGWIESVVAQSRINWGEINTAQDLWSLCDKVQEQAGWIQDEKLKVGMLKTLEADLASCQADWMHRHLEQLIKTWKRESQNERRSDAANREFQMKAPEYEPPAASPRKKFKGKEHRRQVIGLMGVGALLAQAREKLQGEEGELKEDEEGGYVEVEKAIANQEKGAEPEEIVEKKGKKRKATPPQKEEKKEKKRKKKERRQLEEGEMASSSSGENSESEGSGEERSSEVSSSTSSGSSSSDVSSSASDSEEEAKKKKRARKKREEQTEEDKKGKGTSKSRQKRKEQRAKKRKALERRLREERKKTKKEKKAAAGVTAAPTMADFTKMMQSTQGSGPVNAMMPQMMQMFQQMWAQRMQMLQKLGPEKQQQTMQKMQSAFQQFQQQYQMQGQQTRMAVPVSGTAAAQQFAAAGGQDWAQQFRSQIPPPPPATSTYSAPPTHYYPPPHSAAQFSMPPPGSVARPQMAFAGTQPPPQGVQPRQPYFGPPHHGR